MSFEPTQLVEAPVAMLTLEWFLLRVDEHVSLKITITAERFTAMSTLARALS